mgnify:CR=1 FL=1
MKYKLLVLDIDGTLLNDQHEITKRTHTALIKAQHMGIRVVIASGRPTCGVSPLAEAIELGNFDGYFFSYNGGKIFDAKSNRLLFEKAVEKEMVPFLLKLSKKHNLAIFTYNRNTILTDSPDNEYVKREAELNGMTIIPSTNFGEDINFAIHKIMLVGNDPEVLDHLAQQEKKRLNGALSIIRSEPYFLEFAPQNIDKANGLSILMDKIGAHKSEVMVIGNGIADITIRRPGHRHGKCTGCGKNLRRRNDAVQQRRRSGRSDRETYPEGKYSVGDHPETAQCQHSPFAHGKSGNRVYLRFP